MVKGIMEKIRIWIVLRFFVTDGASLYAAGARFAYNDCADILLTYALEVKDQSSSEAFGCGIMAQQFRDNAGMYEVDDVRGRAIASEPLTSINKGVLTSKEKTQ
jgi:hypothetical protein